MSYCVYVLYLVSFEMEIFMMTVFTVFNEIRDDWATGCQTLSSGQKCVDGV